MGVIAFATTPDADVRMGTPLILKSGGFSCTVAWLTTCFCGELSFSCSRCA